jgi:hypothetical protein
LFWDDFAPSLESSLFHFNTTLFSLSEFFQNLLLVLAALLPTRTGERKMEAGMPQTPKKRASDAPELQQATPATLTPAPPNASDGPTEKPPLKKRHRRSLDDREKLEVAAVRKRGACEECRRKKEKVRSSLP